MKLLSHCRYFDNSFTKIVPRVVLYPTYYCVKTKLIGCHGNQNAEFAKKYSEIKLKLCRNVYKISLCKNVVCIAVAYALPLLNIPRTL